MCVHCTMYNISYLALGDCCAVSIILAHDRRPDHIVHIRFLLVKRPKYQPLADADL